MSTGATEVSTLSLDGELTIHQAAVLKDRLLAALADGVRCLDLGRVCECDSAGVQLLLAARAGAQARGRPLALAPVSEPVREVLHRYGLAHLLGPAA
jgi:anti-anti-sigma factor